jgi:hypothetical protein
MRYAVGRDDGTASSKLWVSEMKYVYKNPCNPYSYKRAHITHRDEAVPSSLPKTTVYKICVLP